MFLSYYCTLCISPFTNSPSSAKIAVFMSWWDGWFLQSSLLSSNTQAGDSSCRPCSLLASHNISHVLLLLSPLLQICIYLYCYVYIGFFNLQMEISISSSQFISFTEQRHYSFQRQPLAIPHHGAFLGFAILGDGAVKLQ